MAQPSDILETISARRETGEPFAIATVVRTVAATAAKAGAKAVILPDGTISEGWIGGGCARAAVVNAAKDAIADGRSRLVSVQPPDALDQQGLKPGEDTGGVRFANNMCPSQGTMDIFIEPVLPRPQVVVCGASPVAVAVAEFAKRAGFAVTACAPAAEQGAFTDVDRRIEGYALPVGEAGRRYLVISTQGRGDEAALLAALAIDADYMAFVGSRRKAEVLKAKLAQHGVSAERLAKLKAPAGLDLGAITPDEIAISILAEIIAARRGKDLRWQSSIELIMARTECRSSRKSHANAFPKIMSSRIDDAVRPRWEWRHAGEKVLGFKPAPRELPNLAQMLFEKLQRQTERTVGFGLAIGLAAEAGEGVVGAGIFVNCHQRVR